MLKGEKRVGGLTGRGRGGEKRSGVASGRHGKAGRRQVLGRERSTEAVRKRSGFPPHTTRTAREETRLERGKKKRDKKKAAPSPGDQGSIGPRRAPGPRCGAFPGDWSRRPQANGRGAAG